MPSGLSEETLYIIILLVIKLQKNMHSLLMIIAIQNHLILNSLYIKKYTLTRTSLRHDGTINLYQIINVGKKLTLLPLYLLASCEISLKEI